MTNDEKVRNWAELARHDGDEEAALAIEALLMERDVERTMREERERLLAGERERHGTTEAALRQAVAERDDERRWRERATHAVSALRSELEEERRTGADLRRERDDLRNEHEEDQGVIRVWRGRCERAEADNAALCTAVDDLLRHHTRGTMQAHDAAARARTLREQPHPGAALLDYLRAMEKVREAAARITANGAGWLPESGALCEALTAVDALKVKP